uniref:EAL domain-containing protein n=1 Tax=Lachnospira sp. TaxID=2049031 RepID=UPI003FEFDE86
MRLMYSLMIIIEIVLLGICAVKSINKKGKLAKIVLYYEAVAFIAGVFFWIYTYVPGINITTFCKGVTFACYDWLVILLMYYTQYYTGLFKGVLAVKITMMLYSAIDSFVMIANTWTHNVFTISEITKGEIVVDYVKTSFFYQAHFIYNYVVIIVILISFIFMIAKSSRFYSFRYQVIFIALFSGFVLDLATVSSQSIYDLSTPIYGFMSMIIYYLTLSYVPNELIENTLSLIIKDMNSGIVCFDIHGKCIYCNDILRELYGIGHDYEEMEKEYRKWIQSIEENRKDSMKMETSIYQNGEKKYYEIAYKRTYDDKQNQVCDYFIFNDRTEDVVSLEHEKYRASHDTLTGLLNKEQFYIETAKLIKENRDVKYCLVCSNIKDFKFVNELFGIEKGNEILKKQAEYMKNFIGEDSLAARLHADRFAMCMPRIRFDEDLINEAITGIQEAFKNSSFHMHIFVGVYDIHDVQERVSIMCDKANLASETIKNEYKSSVAYYTEHLLEKSIEERKIIGEFDRALDNEEFVMFLQPQVDVSGKPFGSEALVRWQHPDKGLLAPGVFIDVLEKTGFVYRLDRYMWDKAVKQLAEWKKRGINDYHISVNISTKDFYLIDVYETFVGLVEKYDIDPKLLKLEITETALMSDFNKNMVIIKRLQKYGFDIEIDDFGSGYSSLNMLKDISADVLKIDMGFLRASENEVKGQDILESIIGLANKLGMRVITEGVEKKTQVDMLYDMGCKMFQGYYFSKPIPVDEFEKKYNIG